MTEILSPVSILEYRSTSIHLGIYDEKTFNKNIFIDQKIDFTRNYGHEKDQIILDIITQAEKEINQHLNEVILILDSSSISSLDFSIRKNFDKKLITNKDINYLVNECENEVKVNNPEKEVLHVIKCEIFFDDEIIKDIDNISKEASKIVIELKFILISKNLCDQFKKLLLKKHIKLKNIFCASYIKSLGLIKKLDISGYSAFIDIGLKKSSLSIFNNNKLLYLNNTHIGGDHITQDISKILKIDYRMAESKKIKFYKNNLLEDTIKEEGLLKKIINSRLEEIIELLFLNCPLVANNFFNTSLKLYFTGNGSKVLSENLLSFGPEFNFINEMSIIDEINKDIFDSAYKFNAYLQQNDQQKINISLENKGFFERLFQYFNRK